MYSRSTSGVWMRRSFTCRASWWSRFGITTSSLLTTSWVRNAYTSTIKPLYNTKPSINKWVFLLNVKMWMLKFQEDSSVCRRVFLIFSSKYCPSYSRYLLPHHQFDGLVQEKRNSSDNALELRLSCTIALGSLQPYRAMQNSIITHLIIIHTSDAPCWNTGVLKEEESKQSCVHRYPWEQWAIVTSQ